MNILITGAKGFVGKNLVEALKNVKFGKDKSRGITEDIDIFEYDIDTEALAIYEAGASTTVNFGVVAIAEHKYNSEKDLVKVDGTTEQTNIILANVSGKGSQTVSLIINGAESQWNQYKETPFYILGYAINAGTVEYFQNTSKNNFADLDTISYNQAKEAVA